MCHRKANGVRRGTQSTLLLLTVLVVGVQALVPMGHALCFKACGEVAVAVAGGPHSCSHDHAESTRRGCDQHDCDTGHGTQSCCTDEPQDAACSCCPGESSSPHHSSCTDLDPSDPFVDSYRAVGLCKMDKPELSWSPRTAPPLTTQPAFLHETVPRNRGPSPDAHTLPLRV